MNGIDCMQARDLMLEADVSELSGAGPDASELARHIAACGDCRNQAQRILRGYADLERGLQAVGRKRRATSRFTWIPIPLAAAAVLTLVLARQNDPLPDMSFLTARMTQQQPVVTPPSDRQAIVIEKNDLTVVWLY